MSSGAERGEDRTARGADLAPPAQEAGIGRVLRDAWVIARKDFQTEIRSKEILLTMGFFGFLVVLVFSFAFIRGDMPVSWIAPGTLWVAVAFSGTLGLGRIFDREREGDCIRALLLSPTPRTAIYLGKVLSMVIFMVIVELVVVPGVLIFFTLPADPERLLVLASVIFLGTLGYAIVGTLLAASLLRAHSKDVLLAVVLYPILIPAIIAGVKATGAVFAEAGIEYAIVEIWMKVLLVFDMVFLVASLWLFELLILD